MTFIPTKRQLLKQPHAYFHWACEHGRIAELEFLATYPSLFNVVEVAGVGIGIGKRFNKPGVVAFLQPFAAQRPPVPPPPRSLEECNRLRTQWMQKEKDIARRQEALAASLPGWADETC